MGVNELIKALGWDSRKFYNARLLGTIPAPQSGVGIRKKYSPSELARIVSKLKKMGELPQEFTI